MQKAGETNSDHRPALFVGVCIGNLTLAANLLYRFMEADTFRLLKIRRPFNSLLRFVLCSVCMKFIPDFLTILEELISD